MNRIKKAVLSLMTIALIISSLAFSFSAYATTYQELTLNKIYSASISGGDDMIWYTYTPRESGTYSLISYSSGKTVAYLYVRTTNPDGSRTYTGLAYAPASDPNYQEEGIQYFYDEAANNKKYTHYSTSFRLTYHLDAGTKYYFSAGYPYESTSSGTINTLLRQDSVDSDIKTVTDVSVACDSRLYRYCDGEWKTDSDGKRYYKYNISKITQNMTITLHYSDGTSLSAKGVDVIDGYNVRYTFNQEERHWYADTDLRHTQNILTITVNNISCDFDVPIEVGPNYNVRGVITDYTNGEPVAGARIYAKELYLADENVDEVYLGETDNNGEFHFNYGCGTYFLTIERDDAYTREIMLTISQTSALNDHRATPIPLFTGDYVRDGIINGKDVVYISKMFSAEIKDKEMEKSCNQFAIRETDNFYKELSI